MPVDQLMWTQHAAQRAKERFPTVDLEAEFFDRRTRRPGRNTRKKIFAKCLNSSKKYGNRMFNGRYVLLSPAGVVFIVAQKNTIITVFQYDS